MILVNENDAAAAAQLLSHVGKRCEVAVRGPGYGINVNGLLRCEEGIFSVCCVEPGDLSHGTAVFEARHVETLRQSKRGTLLVTLRTQDP